MIKLVVFVVTSMVIVFISWRSLPKPRSHGFYRFFAFELLLILILINIDYWLEDPLSIHQLISWFLLFVSLILAIHGFYLLWVMGKPKGGEEETSNLAFENTTQLVTIGAYKYIRHPLYASLLLLGWGIFFKYPTLLGGVLALVISVFLTATAKAEENENIIRFGDDYLHYRETTRMFIPWLI